MAEAYILTIGWWRVVWVDDEGNSWYRDFPNEQLAQDFARTATRDPPYPQKEQPT